MNRFYNFFTSARLVRALSLGVMLFFVVSLNAQAVGDYSSQTSGNWEVASTWQIVATTGPVTYTTATVPPTTNDVARVENGHTVTVTTAGAVGKNCILFGTLNVDATKTLALSGTLFYVNAAAACTVNNSGSISATGLVTIQGNPTSTFNNSGTLTASGGIKLETGATLTNSGTINTAGVFTLNSGSELINNTSATIAKSGGNFLQNSGSTFTNNGALNRNGTGAYTFAGTYQGTGSFAGSLPVAFVNTGTVTVGTTTTAGCLTFGSNFNNTGATLNINIKGATACTQFDQLIIAGNGTIAGTINISFGFTPTAGQKFKIANITGSKAGGATFNITPSTITASYDLTMGEITVDAVLPVELANFQAKSTQKSALLTWATATEKDNAYFDIEQSTNGKEFQTIGQVKGRGTTTGERVYNYEHTTPSVGINYYRLKQVDVDGKETLSKIVSVNFDKNKTSKVYPTLVKDIINVEFSGHNGATDVQIINLLGQVVKAQKLQNTEGVTPMNISDLATGSYIMRLVSKSGSESHRFEKQ